MMLHHQQTLIFPNPNPPPPPPPPSRRLQFSLLVDLLLDDSDVDTPHLPSPSHHPHDPPPSSHNHNLLLTIQRSLQDIIDSGAAASSSARKRKLFQPNDDAAPQYRRPDHHPPAAASLCSSSGDSDYGWAAAEDTSPAATPGSNCCMESRPHSQKNVDSARTSRPALDSICCPDELSSCSSPADYGGCQNQRCVLMRQPEKPRAGRRQSRRRLCPEDRSVLSCSSPSSGAGSVVSQEFGCAVAAATTMGARCFNPSTGTDFDGAPNFRQLHDDELTSDATSSFSPINALRSAHGT